MISVLVAGDFVPYERTIPLVEQNCFDEIFGTTTKITKDVDYSIVNFESPVVLNKAFRIIKTGPNIKCSKKALEAVRFAGFNCVTLANNHFYDYGDIGVKDTIEACSSLEIDYVGGGNNIDEANRILYKKIKDKVVAIINVCENEWSIASESHGGSAPLNFVSVYNNIQLAKDQADFILLIIHGGTEHYNLPSLRMQENYRFFIDAGADAVVNHHQHCYSGYEIYKNKPIFYGIGNFCFDLGRDAPNFWKTGFLVKLFFDKDISFDLIPYLQCDKSPNVSYEVDFSEFRKELEVLNKIILDKNQLKLKFKQLAEKESRNYLINFEPFKNRLISSLQYRNILPLMCGKQKLRVIYALNRCESHRDLLFEIIKNRIK